MNVADEGDASSGVVVAGMHRSGTSLMTALIAAGGFHPGDTLLTGPTRADGHAEEYLEDASFVSLHRSWLADALGPEAVDPTIDPHAVPDGHRDWGVTTGARQAIDLTDLGADVRQRHETMARAYAADRSDDGGRWVAKDPRATLFLPTWTAVDGLRFVLVYRCPWDVVDSAVRLGADVFCRRPRLALAAWLDHNRRLIEFATAHRDRCVVVAAETLTVDPHRVWNLLDRALGLEGSPPVDLVDPTRFVRRDDNHAIAHLYRDVYPDHVAVLTSLDAIADLPRPIPPVPAGNAQTPAPPGGTLPSGTGVQVVVPCRDDGDFLVEAVASVEGCARPDVELTIVDDGSTDGETLRVLNALRFSGRQVITTPGVGLAAARNAGAAASRSCAVLPLDADNRVRPTLLDALWRIEEDHVDVIHGPWQRFGQDVAVVDPPEITLDALVPGNSVDNCALLRRDLLDRLGGWDSRLTFWDDWDLWLGAVAAGARFERLDAITFDYLVRPDSLSTKAADPEASKATVGHILAKHAALLGNTTARLVEEIHALHLVYAEAAHARRSAESEIDRLAAAQRALTGAYDELAGGYRSLSDAHGDLEHAHAELERAYRDLEGAYQDLERSYRNLEHTHRALTATRDDSDGRHQRTVRRGVLRRWLDRRRG